MASPTLRRRRLSRLLRELRDATGMTAGAVAKEAKERSGKTRGWSASKLTRLEGAEWKRAQADDVLTLLDIYGIDDAEERRAYVTLAREANQQGWWSTFGDALGNGHFVGLESEASAIRTYESMTIPGLLQTPEYARAVRGSGHQRLRHGRYASSTAGLPGTGRLPGRPGHPRNGLKRNRRTMGADAFARHLLIPFECPREFFDAPRPRENHARFQVVESVRSSRWGEAGSFEPARCAGTKGGRTLW